MKKILKWVAIVFVALVVIGLIFGKDENKNSSSTPEPNNAVSDVSNETQQPEAIPPMEVTSEEILKAYKTNEIAANKKFKDQNLLVSGRIDSIEADFSDDPVIVFKTADQYEFLKPRASLAKDEQDKAAELAKGQDIKLLCSKISEVAGMPTLSECVIK